MGKITSKRSMPYSAAHVYSTAKQVERFPEVLPNVDEVKICEDDGAGHTVTYWAASFKVGPLTKQVKWTERDTWDEPALSCVFDLIEGDMKVYSGVWTFKPEGNGCVVDIAVDFELGIPLLGPMINSIVDQLMQQNCNELLAALEQLSAS
jgi:coenzyme Q-binding protein COQ10